jgi:hypothetical protein
MTASRRSGSARNLLGPARSAVLAVIASAGCADKLEPAIIIEINSNLRPPGEIDRLSLKVSAGGSTIDRSFTLGPQKLQLPAKFAVVRDGAGGGEVTIEAAVASGTRQVVSRRIVAEFWPEGSRTLKIDLNGECALRTCKDRTCVPGWGCVGPKVGADGNPVEPRNGPPCDCNSFFPVCLGSWWVYRVYDPTTKKEYERSWIIAGWGKLIDESSTPERDKMFSKEAVEGFILVRLSPIENMRRWGERRPDGTIVWHKYESFDGNKLFDLRYFLPEKLRINENYQRVGDTWPEAYKEFPIRSDGTLLPILEHDDTWEVVSFADTKVKPSFPFDYMTGLCHKKMYREKPAGGDPKDGVSGMSTYCFVRGVGKVYENEPNVEIETLDRYHVEGCSESPRKR